MKWTVENSMFIGETLCDKREDLHLEEMGIKVESDNYWLPVCIDLRVMASIRQRAPDGEEEHWTVMEGIQPDIMYTVNADFHSIVPHFLASRK